MNDLANRDFDGQLYTIQQYTCDVHLYTQTLNNRAKLNPYMTELVCI